MLVSIASSMKQRKFQKDCLSCHSTNPNQILYANFNSQFNEAQQVSIRLVELSLSYDNKKFPKIVLPNSRHVSSIQQEGVHVP